MGNMLQDMLDPVSGPGFFNYGALKRQEEDLRKDRKEEREETKLDIHRSEHKHFIKQTKYLLWTLVATAGIGLLNFLFEIFKYFFPSGG